MQLRGRFLIEVGAAVIVPLTVFGTIVRHDWIEAIAGVGPDHGSGLIEWTIAAALAAFTIACSALARNEWRRARADSQEAAHV